MKDRFFEKSPKDITKRLLQEVSEGPDKARILQDLCQINHFFNNFINCDEHLFKEKGLRARILRYLSNRLKNEHNPEIQTKINSLMTYIGKLNFPGVKPPATSQFLEISNENFMKLSSGGRLFCLVEELKEQSSQPMLKEISIISKLILDDLSHRKELTQNIKILTILREDCKRRGSEKDFIYLLLKKTLIRLIEYKNTGPTHYILKPAEQNQDCCCFM